MMPTGEEEWNEDNTCHANNGGEAKAYYPGIWSGGGQEVRQCGGALR